MDYSQQLGAMIFAVVSSDHACGGIPSNSSATLNVMVPTSACARRVQGISVRNVPANGNSVA